MESDLPEMFQSSFLWGRYLPGTWEGWVPATTLSEDRGPGEQLCRKVLRWRWAASWTWACGVPWQQRQPAAPELCDQGYGPEIKGRDCHPLCSTCQTMSRYWVEFWDLTQERCGQTGGTSVEGPQGGEAGALSPWREPGGDGLHQPGEGMALGHLTAPSTEEGSWRIWSWAPREAAEQFTPSGWAISILGGFQVPTGPSFQQPGLTPALVLLWVGG